MQPPRHRDKPLPLGPNLRYDPRWRGWDNRWRRLGCLSQRGGQTVPWQFDRPTSQVGGSSILYGCATVQLGCARSCWYPGQRKRLNWLLLLGHREPTDGVDGGGPQICEKLLLGYDVQVKADYSIETDSYRFEGFEVETCDGLINGLIANDWI